MASNSVSQSVNDSASQSASSSFIPSYAEEPILMALSQYTGQLGEQVSNWANNVWGNVAALSDDAIGSYNDIANTASNNAANYNAASGRGVDQYNNLIHDANSYNSAERQQFEAGRAEARETMAGQHAMDAHKRDLQSFGIDPSSGRYADLDEAGRLSTAAAAAGAGTNAVQNTAQAGRQMRNEAIQAGSQYGNLGINSENTALQGVAGMSNTNLATANTGVNLQQAANPYFNTAMSLKYPTLGNQSASASASHGESASTSASSDGSGGGGGGSSGGSGSQSPSSGGGSTAGGGSGGGGGGFSSGGGGGGGMYAPYGYTDDSLYGLDGSGYTPDGSGGGSYGFDDSGYNSGGWGGDPYAGGGSDSAGYNSGGYGGDPYSGGYDSGYGGGSDSSYSDGSYYAEGGPVTPQGPYQNTPVPQAQRPMSPQRFNMTGGGHVKPGMSPSQGQQVDDVRANLNAGEFVIPRDVAAYKGREFFEKLIQGARKNNMNANAQRQQMRNKPHGR